MTKITNEQLDEILETVNDLRIIIPIIEELKASREVIGWYAALEIFLDDKELLNARDHKSKFFPEGV